MRVIVMIAAAAVTIAVKDGPAAQDAPQAVASTGPVIDKFGPVYDVPDAALLPDPSAFYKVVFEIADSHEEKGTLNPSIETLARFLNMQARAGVPAKNLQLAMVVHGGSTKDLIDHSGYRRRYGVDNPNVDLLAALRNAGVRLYVCGQSLAARGVSRDELAPGVAVALSAMTAILRLESEGYRLLQ